MDISSYLQRILYVEHPEPNVKTLFGLHRAHMRYIPFENLDIVRFKRPIKIDEESIWDKLINQKRGGFCYELNGLFAWLLKQIGFNVTYLNARVFNSMGDLGIDFDHLALLVTTPDQAAGRWLADAGFGDSFELPLRLESDIEQVQGMRSYKLEQKTDGYIVWQRNYDDSWERHYFFDLTPHKFPEEYEAACIYHQTSPNTSFTQSSIISHATEEGRVSLEDGWLILTKNGTREKRPVTSETEYKTLLREHFEIIL